MELLIITVFVIGYLAIAFEHPLKINKTASAIITGVLCWTLFMFSVPSEDLLQSEHFLEFTEELKSDVSDSSGIFRAFVTHELSRHLASISEILFFLLGAMTIVELVDSHHGFRFITDRIRTKNPKVLLWIVCFVTFFLSSILDNLTTTIVMVSLVRKLIADKETRMLFIGMIVIAANAGGAWTPIGDVTTTMLWIGGQISTVNIMKILILPSIVCLLTPLIFLSFTLKGSIAAAHGQSASEHLTHSSGKGNLMLALGVGTLIAVPIFKMSTHLPPYTGMLLGLGILWVISEFVNPEADEVLRKKYTAAGALARVDVPSVLFFLGILLAVGALESMHTLNNFAEYLNTAIGNHAIIITLIGALSAIVDNVPLVAASMGMYSLTEFPTDHFIWEYLAYCAGTGGSILIIGSAAGVAAMGIEKIDFIWYLKRVSFLALIGYLAGAGVYLLTHRH